MKKKIFYAIIAAVIGTATASAYDVKVDNIYYNIVDDAYLEVTAIEDYLEYYNFYFDAPAKREATTFIPNDYAGEIVIPDSVKIDGYDAALPVKAIRHSAFWNAQKLVSVTLPATIEKIGNGAFACSSMKLLDMGAATIETMSEWMCHLSKNLSKVIMPSGVKSIEGGAFSETAIEEFTIPESVSWVGDQAFCMCAKLTTLNGGQAVTSYGYYCFDTTNLTTIEIYDCVMSLGGFAYSGIKSLKNVICHKLDPNDFYYQSDMSSVFWGSNSDCTLWVPDESVDLYKKSKTWTSFFHDIRPLSQAGIRQVLNAGTESAKLYDLNGREIASPENGRIYISADGKKVRF